ncbi:glycosyl hydrolase family 18 protein [Niallia sp. MER TA 168]|uniref:glycosyl hydrolase family 18 protein n=1 Tax=Niallia sp. MER TA 168 TaxID=2939568 RepID=UPI002040DB7D|nr:glycosyl hydrolase family 18 protein [Niallia sp. MER TA 168]MCM3362100.1 glycosyl hydrolase family 18 protein [Niallia sp. MER TA 168]
MELRNFDQVDIKEVNGEYTLILRMKEDEQPSYDTEFGSEFFYTTKKNGKTLITATEQFIKKEFPKIKKATIILAVGTVILASFPFQKAEAHEVTFNMSYLYFGNTKSYISQIDKTQGNLSLVSPSYFDINADGSLKITTQYDSTFVKEMHSRGMKVVPFLSNHWDRNVGRAALNNREKLSTQIADFIMKNNLDGIQVDIENTTEIDRDAYTDLVRLLREKLPSDKEVSVAVAANPNGWTKGWHGTYDYKELAKYSSYLMVMAYDESYEGSKEGPVASYGWVENSIQYALKQGISPDKIVLGIPFYGRYWKEGEATGGTGISNVRVDELLSRYGGTVVFDEATKSPKATITIKQGDPVTTIAGKTLTPGTYKIWYENSDSIAAKFELIHKYNLKGSGSWSLGQESTSIWQNYRTWMSDNGQVAQQQEQLPTTQKSTTYTVQSGDSLWKIATSYSLTVDQLKQLNKLTSDTIFVGQVLNVSSTSENTQNSSLDVATSTNEVSKPATQTTTKPAESVVVVPPAKTTTTTSVTAEKSTATAKAVTSAKQTRYPTLKSGSKGAAVTDMQNKLKKTKLYTGKVNGVYDTATRKAVIAFQKKYKLKADGIAGTATLSKLDSVIAATKTTTVAVKKYPTLKQGSQGTAVKDMQNKLIKTKIYKGKALGKYDTATKKAVIAFQKKYKLTADGIAGPVTLAKLDSVTKSK